MPKVKKTYRIDADLLNELDKYTKEKGISQTEAVEAAIRNAIHKPDACHTQKAEEDGTSYNTIWKELFLQEHEKLLALTDKVADSLQAAQTLQAMDKPVLESPEQKEERKTRWQRLKEAWNG